MRISHGRHQPSPARKQECENALERLFGGAGAPLKRLLDDESGWTRAAAEAARWRDRFDHLIVVGIGGSSLGGQVLCSLSPSSRVRFIENVDPWGLEATVRGLELSKTLFAFVSKSGRTIETLASLDYLRELAAAAGVELTKQCVAMTAVPSSPLGRWAASAGVPTLALPEDVSGRFSVFTMAGLFPAAFDGLSLEAIRAGALQAWNDRTLAAELMAASLSSFAREEWISLFWFYEGRGRLFGAWLQQLWAESLAKKVRRDGSAAARVSTPLAALGTVDQHSLLQQVAEGARDKWTVFVRFDETEKGPRTLAAATFEDCKHLVGRPLGRLMSAEANATERALAEMGVSTLVLRNEAFDARGVGRLLMFFQLVVGGLGEVLGIDPFNQPGVELGKVLALQDLAGG